MKNYYVIALIALLGSCETPSDCTEHYFSDKYKSYVYANPGSYWIFEDTILGITDTIHLVSQSFQFNDICSVSHRPQEELEQVLTSSFFKGNNAYRWTAYGYAELNEYSAGYILGWYSDYEGTMIDSMLVKGIWYKNILEFTTTHSKYYWSEEVGVIKKEFSIIDSGDTAYHFELKNYFLND